MEETANINKSLDEKYRNNVVEGMIQEIQRLDSCPEFVHDDSFHGYASEDHIMYKLGTLYSEDGKRAYEFLFEFDKKDYEYGIYFGCRGLIFDGNVLEQILIFDNEWEKVKKRIIGKLNRTYRSNDFNKRVRITNNCNDFTYWTFWIKLYDDEDITQKVQKMLSIISDAYKKYLHLTEVSGVDKHHINGPTRFNSLEPIDTPNWNNLPFKKDKDWAGNTKKVLLKFLEGAPTPNKKRHIVVAIYIVLHAIAYDNEADRDRTKFAQALHEIAPEFCDKKRIKGYIDEFFELHGKRWNKHKITEVFGREIFESEYYKGQDKDESIERYIEDSCEQFYNHEGEHNVSKPYQKAKDGITSAAKKIYYAIKMPKTS